MNAHDNTSPTLKSYIQYLYEVHSIQIDEASQLFAKKFFTVHCTQSLYVLIQWNEAAMRFTVKARAASLTQAHQFLRYQTELTTAISVVRTLNQMIEE